MTDWNVFKTGMAAARTVPDVACQATIEEALAAGGPDFLGQDARGHPPDWQHGYDHAILLARRSTPTSRRQC